ncbi:Long-chain-fatty-acid--CoA ligase FadD15 [Actinomyces succiniciruminis]|uniref:Acyl-CoA synthetase n=2 Tax=Actinomyces succiniciruminis TaxID=1522002 RepID=A0A1L7RP83_9ACTO|nr:AMP-dependent synthetase/ligase [Actinomyces succiniciruminis]CED91472.1 Long-chain-fatty-acid--CoA ligase FadD15 [Actinomyces succiniciruminis]
MSQETNSAEAGAPTASPREHSTPLLVPLHAAMTAPWALAERVRTNPTGALIARKSSVGGRWRDMSAQAFRDQVREVASGLIALGLEAGDALGIMAHTCYEWTLLDFAAWEAGLVVVPIYETSSAEQTRWILTDAAVRLVVVEDQPMETMLTALADQDPALAGLRVLSLAREAITELITAGKDVRAAELDARAAQLTSTDLATIVYTSGTTGRPKGAELTHDNLVHLCVNACAHVPEVLEAPETRTLLFLPLAHVLGRFVEMAIVCSSAGVLGHAPNVKNLVTDLASFRPTFVPAVPRVFEKIYNAADARATGAKQKVFRLAAKTAIAYSRALDTPAGPSRGLRAQRAAFDRLVFSTLRNLLGGRVTHVISGGGPLGERLGHFYRGAGVTVLEGYGLTETSAPCTVNLPAATRIGSVGLPLPGTAVRLDADGEVLISGIGVFRGYHNNPEASAEAFVTLPDAAPAQTAGTDPASAKAAGASGTRWLRSGDIGTLDADGFLHITGRKKELIVTAGGKNVAPAVLEDRLRGHPLVSQVLVVGENRPCIGALVTLDAEMLPLWLSSHGLPDMDPIDAAQDPRVRAALERAVARANEAVSRAESIRTFTVLPGDFTEANGLLTPSLKVRRDEATKRFAKEIDELYTRV